MSETEPAADGPEHWLDQHGDALYAFALLRVRQPATAEDLVQETLLAALSAQQRFEARASRRTWLIGILKNKIVDHLRRAGREQALPDDDDGEDVFADRFDATGHWRVAPADWGDPAALAENRALGAALAECIGHLPDKLRRPFVLREIDGMDSAEVIALLGISSAGNLWVMLSRARERVRECLQRNWGGAGR